MGVSLNPNARWTHTIATDLVLPVSYCGWVRVDTDRNNFTTVCWLGDDTSTDHCVLIALNSDGVSPILYDSNFDSDVTGAALTVGTWYFLAATATSAAGGLKLYRVAELGTLALTDSSTYTGTFDGELIGIGGGRPDGEANAVNADASFAHWRFWTAELSLSELQAEMASATPVRTANLWASYRFENTSNHTTDGSGNGRTLTATAGTGSFANTGDPNLGGTPQALDGHASAASSATGSLTVSHPLSGNAAAATDATAALTVTRDLSGTASAAAAATGALDVTLALAGSTPAAAEATGDLTVERPLAGTPAAASDSSGNLTVAHPLDGTAASAASASGDLTAARLLEGAAPSASTAIGDLTVVRALAGAAAVASSAAGTLLDVGAPTDISILVGAPRLRPLAVLAGARPALSTGDARLGTQTAAPRHRELALVGATRGRGAAGVAGPRTGWATGEPRTSLRTGPPRNDRSN